MIKYFCDICGEEITDGKINLEMRSDVIPGGRMEIIAHRHCIVKIAGGEQRMNELQTSVEPKTTGKKRRKQTASEPARPPSTAEDPVVVAFKGRDAKEKGRIHAKMRAFREKRGLGCWGEVAKLANVSTDKLRMVYSGELPATMEQWHRIERAMDDLENQTDEKDNQ